MLIDDDGEIGADGEFTHTASFDPGHYVIFAVVHDGSGGIETVGSGDITVNSDVMVIGTDQLLVQQGQRTVTEPSDPDEGENLTFTVDSSDAFSSSKDGSITHAVALYKKSTFEDSRFDLVVDESELGNDFSMSDDAQLEHSIDEVNGIARVEDGTTLNGNELADGKVARPVGASSLIDFVADEAGTEDPNTHAITNGGESPSEYEQIDASVTAVNGEDRVTEVSVDTLSNFSPGDYQYVVVSTLDGDETKVSTATGTIDLGSGGGGGGGGGVSGPSTVKKIATISTPGGTATVTVPAVAAQQSVVMDVVDQSSTETGASVSEVQFTSQTAASNVQMSVRQANAPDDGTPAVDKTRNTFRYVNVDLQNVGNSDATPGQFTFTVSEERRSELDAAPEDVVMYRYDGDSWNAIETTHLGGEKYRADTPGFSWFAIGTAEPAISVSDASLASTSIQPGDTTDVTAQLENDGLRAGNVTLDVTVDGDIVESRTVTVDAESTTSETFTLTLDDAGEYDIAINGTSAGTISVIQQTPGDESTEKPAIDETEEQSNNQNQGQDDNQGQGQGEGQGQGPGIPLIGVGIVVILAVIAAIAYTYRDQL